MGTTYQLVNLDKEERLDFYQVNTGTQKRELSGTIVSGNLVTYYLLKNTGDRIAFVDESCSTFVLFGQEYQVDQFWQYPNVTQAVVEELIALNILRDDGIIWIDEEEQLFFRDLKNVWDPQGAPNPTGESK